MEGVEFSKLDEIPTLPENVIDVVGSAPRIVWIRVRDAIGMLWVDNPKIHDIPKTIQSIHKYGFQELPVIDTNLENVRGSYGAIKAGNGRIEALDAMERQEYDVPRHVATERATGYWAIAVISGTDAISRAMAEAYAVDSNNLVVAGTDSSSEAMRALWSDGYIDIINRLLADDMVPISIDDSDLMALVSGMEDIGDIDLNEFEDAESPEVAYKVIIDGLTLEGAEEIASRINKMDDVSEDARVEQYRV